MLLSVSLEYTARTGHQWISPALSSQRAHCHMTDRHIGFTVLALLLLTLQLFRCSAGSVAACIGALAPDATMIVTHGSDTVKTLLCQNVSIRPAIPRNSPLAGPSVPCPGALGGAVRTLKPDGSAGVGR